MFYRTEVWFDGDVLVVRRPLWPEEVVQGRANVVVFLDGKGRIAAIQIDFVEYNYIGGEVVERKRNVLRKARW
jgi:hypothetical protein